MWLGPWAAVRKLRLGYNQKDQREHKEQKSASNSFEEDLELQVRSRTHRSQGCCVVGTMGPSRVSPRLLI